MTGQRPGRNPWRCAVDEPDRAQAASSGVVTVWHLMFAASGRNVMFRDEGSRLAAVRRIGRKAGNRMVVFGLVDEHIHVAAPGERPDVGRLARTLLLATRPWTSAKLEPAHIIPVANRRHLHRLVRYILDQPAHHDLPVHPALWSGSCFADLIGARVVPGLHLQLAEVLPRFRLREAFEVVGLPGEQLRLPAPDTIRRLGACRIAAAAAAALCLPYPLRGMAVTTSLARAAVAQIGRTAGISPSEVAHALSISPRAVRKCHNRPLDGRIVRSVYRRLGLERLVERTSAHRRCSTIPGPSRRQVSQSRYPLGR